MTPTIQGTKQPQGPNLAALGIKSPTEVIDILASLSINGGLVITDDRAFLDPNQKAQAVISYFTKLNIPANQLPHLAAVIKRKLMQGELGFNPTTNKIEISRETLNECANIAQKTSDPHHQITDVKVRLATVKPGALRPKTFAPKLSSADTDKIPPAGPNRKDVKLYPEVGVAYKPPVEIVKGGTLPFVNLCMAAGVC